MPDDRVDAFIDIARETLHGMFGSIVANDDYCSSVNEANFDRVVGLIDDARVRGATVETVAPAGESLPDRATRKIAPTIVRDVEDTMRIANEEVFGPVLVGRPYSALTDVIDHINQRPAPLVAYWYGPDDDDFRHFVHRTRSGGVARNDFGAQMVPSAAPFGGRPQRHGCIPREGRLRRLQSLSDRGGHRSAVHHHRTGRVPVQRFDAPGCEHGA